MMPEGLLLQFTDRALIAGKTLDANAFRGSPDQLRTLLTVGGDEDEMAGWNAELVNRAMELLENIAGVYRVSTSPLRRLGEGPVNTCAGFAWTADGLTHAQFVKQMAEEGHTPSIARLMEVASALGNPDYPDRQHDAKVAQLLLAGLGRGVCLAHAGICAGGRSQQRLHPPAWPTEATYSSPAARNEAHAGRASVPSAYDLVFASNFLTQSETIDEFRHELSDLARSLTPGGLLVALGGKSAKYEKIWSEAERLMRGADVVPVREVDIVLPAHPDPERRQVILRQLIADRNRLRDLGAVLPRWMEELNSREKFPSFRVKAWQRQTGRRTQRRTLVSPSSC